MSKGWLTDMAAEGPGKPVKLGKACSTQIVGKQDGGRIAVDSGPNSKVRPRFTSLLSESVIMASMFSRVTETVCEEKIHFTSDQIM